MAAQLIENLDMNSGEFGPVDGAAEEVPPVSVNSLVNALVEKALAPENVVIEEVSDEAYMNEADKRLEIATYYRELTRVPLFNNTSEASQFVEKEIRTFTRCRLEVLLGIKPDNKPTTVFKSPFSEEEIATLKLFGSMTPVELSTLRMILDAVLSKNTPKTETKQEPSVRPAPTPETRQVPKITARQMPAVTPATQPVVATAPVPVAASVEAKRGPGRPKKDTITVEDPMTGEIKQLKVTGSVKNPRALPMPTGAGLHAATMVASSRSVASMEQTPAAKLILGT